MSEANQDSPAEPGSGAAGGPAAPEQGQPAADQAPPVPPSTETSATVATSEPAAPDATGAATPPPPPPPAPPSEAAGSEAAAPSAASAAGSEVPIASGGAGGSVKSSPSTPRSRSDVRSEAGGSSRHSSQARSSPGAGSHAGGSSHRPAASPSGAGRSSGRHRKRQRLGELDLNTARIGFLGGGKMTETTVLGLIHYAKVSPSRIHVAVHSRKNIERFKNLKCHVTLRNYDIFGRYDCDIIFLAFHGHVIKECYKQGGARPHAVTTNFIPHQRHPIYVLSLVSGIGLSQIKACLLNPDSQSRYVAEFHRIMLNTAVSQGLGICAIDCEPDSKRLSPPIRQLLSSIAHLEHVPAPQMDAACALGGAGLAFCYYFINAMADGAFKIGLSRAQAIRFAAKTAHCASQTMLESGKHPSELRDLVSSSGGAALYGIHVLEKADVGSGVTAAVEAAHKRNNDLATQDINSHVAS